MFEVGQEVWDILRGKGEVQSVDRRAPLVYFFKTKAHVWYQADGRISPMFNRSLFFSEPEIDALTKPRFIPKLKKGDHIVIKHSDDRVPNHPWTIKVKEDRETVVLSDSGSLYNKKEYDFYKIGEMIY